MRLLIRHNREVRILSAVKVNIIDDSPDHPLGNELEGNHMLEVKPAGELDDLDCHAICAAPGRFREDGAQEETGRESKLGKHNGRLFWPTRQTTCCQEPEVAQMEAFNNVP